MNDSATAIAVLPFENLSDDPGTGYFARGFVDELTTHLTRFAELRVVRAEHLPLPQAGAPEHDATAWGVDYFLEGRVARGGSTLRVWAQLVKVDGRKTVWAERFDAAVEDVFSIQDDITAAVAGGLAVTIDGLRLERARRASTGDLAAHDVWLRGLDCLRRGTLEGDDEARGYFRRAIEIDPDYGRPWAGLSISHFNEWTCQAWHLFDESRDGAFRYARRAVELDERDAMVHAVLARVHRFRHEHAAADRHAGRALALNPNDPNVLIHVAIARLFGGEALEAHALAARAIELNKTHGPWYFGIEGWSLFMAGRPDEALRRLALAESSIVNFGAYRAACRVLRGDEDAARAEYAAFEREYRDKIAFGREPEPGEALRWAVQVEPFRDPADSRRMPDALRNGALADVDIAEAIAGRPSVMVQPAGIPRPPGATFRRDGATWSMDYGGEGARLVELKGFHDIARLLAEPGVAVHCLELCGAPLDDSPSDEVLDPESRREYRRRLADLAEEIDRAEADQDLARLEPSRVEYARLVEELAKATGLGGRSRKLGDRAERARSAATWRIRSAIKKIRAAHPRLGQHLHNSVRTGTFCTYSPEEPCAWLL